MGWSELGRTSTREQSLPRRRLAGSSPGESEWTERLQDPGEHPPRVVGSMSESPCQAVTISGFFSKSAKFFQTLMAPSSWGDQRGYSEAAWLLWEGGEGPPRRHRRTKAAQPEGQMVLLSGEEPIRGRVRPVLA